MTKDQSSGKTGPVADATQPMLTVGERRKQIKSEMASIRRGMPSPTGLFLMSEAMQNKYEAMASRFFDLEKELKSYARKHKNRPLPLKP